MSIQNIAGVGLPNGIAALPEAELSIGNTKEDQGFAAYLKKSFGDVNQALTAADKLTTEMSIGKSENLHEAMIGMEKAETAFKLLVQVRNRALEAYHEIMRMQV